MIRTGQSRQGSSTSKETIRIRKAVAKATSTLLSKAQVTGKGGRVFAKRCGRHAVAGLIECGRRVVGECEKGVERRWVSGFRAQAKGDPYSVGECPLPQHGLAGGSLDEVFFYRKQSTAESELICLRLQ